MHISERAREEGTFFESINLAIIKKLPVLFFCENNYYSVYTPLDKRQPSKTSYNKALNKFGIKVISSRGRNFNEIFNKIKFAYDYVKKSSTLLFRN